MSMALLRRGLTLGLAFGFAAGTVEIWLSLMPFMERRMGPGPTFMLQVALLQTVLGALLGLVAAPLLLLPAGRFVHLLELALAWWGLERWVADMEEVFDEWRLELHELEEVSSTRLLAVGAIHLRGRGSGVSVDQPCAWLFDHVDGLLTRFEPFLNRVEEARRVAVS